MFLEGHTRNCTPTDPCATCRAVELLRAHNLLDQILEFKAQFENERLDILDEGIRDFAKRHELGVKARNCLLNMMCETVRDLVNKTVFDLIKQPNVGKATREEILSALAKDGLELEQGY